MDDLVKRYLQFLEEEKGYAENTVAAYRNDLSQFAQFIAGYQVDNWNEVGRSQVGSYIESLKEQEYTSSTVARKIAAIKSFFNYLQAEQVVTGDITENLDSPKVKKRLPKAISVDDVNKLLEVSAAGTGPKAGRDRAMLELLYASGMRVTELVSLDVEDIDFEQGVVSVSGKKSGIKAREIPITPASLDALRAYVENGRRQLVRDQKDPALFLNHRGQRLTRQGSWLIIKRYVEAVGISDKVTPHTLRHSFAAHKLSHGQSLQDIQKLLGHANISTTQVYAHLNDETE